jgi:hypothetical protein
MYMNARYFIGLVLLGCMAFAVWTTIKVLTAPSTEEALRRSLSALKRPELDVLYALHPDACSITKVTIWKWSAACVGVPQHFYRDTLYCKTLRRSPEQCRPATGSEDEDCRSSYWDVDLDGNPFDTITNRSRGYASIAEGCNPKGTRASEREEMARRGIRPVLVKTDG